MQTWGIGQSDKAVLWGSYPICVEGITIQPVSPFSLWGAGLSIQADRFLIQLIVTNQGNAVRMAENGIFSREWHPF